MSSTNVIKQVTAWSVRRRRYLQIRQELEAYSDRQLNDLGIARWDIPRIARESIR